MALQETLSKESEARPPDPNRHPSGRCSR
jgi:hypothetical protein